MHPRVIQAKVMDPKIRFCSYSMLLFSFLNCFNAFKRTPCQSHGSPNQILFVFLSFRFLNCRNESKELHAKVMDTKIRCCSYSISFRCLCWMVSIYQRHSMPKSWITKSDFIRISFRFFVFELFHFIMSMWDTIITSSSVTTSNLNTREIWNINSDHKHEHPNRNLDHNHNQMQIPDQTPHTIPEPVTRYHTRPDTSPESRHKIRSSNQTPDGTTNQIPNTTNHTRPETRYHPSHQSSNQISDQTLHTRLRQVDSTY